MVLPTSVVGQKTNNGSRVIDPLSKFKPVAA